MKNIKFQKISFSRWVRPWNKNKSYEFKNINQMLKDNVNIIISTDNTSISLNKDKRYDSLVRDTYKRFRSETGNVLHPDEYKKIKTIKKIISVVVYDKTKLKKMGMNAS